MEKVLNPPTFILGDLGDMLHAGSEWRGEYCTRSHRCLTPDNYSMPDGIALVYGDGILVGSRKTATSLQREVDQREAGPKKYAVTGRGSHTRSGSERRKSELSAFLLETVNVFEDY